MRVGLNLLWLVPGVVGGTEGYATSLLAGLAERTATDTFTVFALPGYVDAYPQLAAALRTVLAPVGPGRRVARRVAIEHSWLARQVRREQLDLLHHLGGVAPLAIGGPPTVVTLHDLQYLAYPDYFSAGKRRYLATMTGQSLRRARVTMMPSRFTRDEAIRRFGLPVGRTAVVPPRLSRWSAPTAAARARVRSTYRLAGEFVLYPAATYPHKNHLLLLDAFARVSRGRPDVTLVLTGATGAGAWGSARSSAGELTERIARLGLTDRVRTLGYLPRDDLPALYAEAAALAYPSRYEGFGLPVVEAMLAGCPVVAADATALPEVVGDGGLLVDPDDVTAWADALRAVLDDAPLRQRLSAAGATRAETLLAADPVDALRSAYRLAVSSPERL